MDDNIFEIPPDYKVEEMLNRPMPRKIPDDVQHAMMRKSQRAAACFAGSAAICLILWFIPIIQMIGLYFLPLQYLDWIAFILLACAFVRLFRFNRKPGLDYFQWGEAVPARIDELGFGPTATYNGVPTQYAYYAVITYLDSNDSQLKQAVTNTRNLGDSARCAMEVTYKVGDYVTALLLPKKVKDPVRLLGFLEMDPGQGLVKKSASSDKTTVMDVIKLSCLLIGVPLFLISLFWNVIAYGRFHPISSNANMYIWPFSLGGVAGLLLVVTSILYFRRSEKEKEVRNQEAMAEGRVVEYGSDSIWGQTGFVNWATKGVLIVGIPLMFGMIFQSWALTLNVWLDRSEEENRLVDITERIMVTHSFVFRDYEVKFRFESEDKERSWLCTPDELAPLDMPVGLAKVRKGAFGWPYVARIVPVPIATEQNEPSTQIDAVE